MYSCMKLIIWNRPPGEEPLSALTAAEDIADPAASTWVAAAAATAAGDTSWSHSLGFPSVGVSHCHPFSILQISLHPSSLSKLPSSHSRLPTTNPSPHISVHVSLVVGVPPVHVHPVSTLHWSSHPSPFKIIKSSHCSGDSLSPFPHDLKSTN